MSSWELVLGILIKPGKQVIKLDETWNIIIKINIRFTSLTFITLYATKTKTKNRFTSGIHFQLFVQGAVCVAVTHRNKDGLMTADPIWHDEKSPSANKACHSPTHQSWHHSWHFNPKMSHSRKHAHTHARTHTHTHTHTHFICLALLLDKKLVWKKLHKYILKPLQGTFISCWFLKEICHIFAHYQRSHKHNTLKKS